MARFTVDNPATGETVTRAEPLSEDRINWLMARASAAARDWAGTGLAERIELCDGFLGRFQAGRDEIAGDITRQMGKPLAESRAELATMERRARFMMAAAIGQLEPMELGGETGVRRFIERVPVGTVLDIAAWNYPMLIAVNVLVPALLAGNSVILKHSSRTPLCGTAFEQAFAEAGAPPGLVQAVTASHQTTAALVGSEEIGYVAFTGSVEGGREVSRAAAGRFIDVGLELGGKDAAYVRADADLESSAAAIAEGAFYNAGQSCCAVERVYADRSIYAGLLEALTEQAKVWRPGDPLADGTRLGPMAKPGAPEAARGQVEEAIGSGARLLAGGQATQIDGLGRYFEATVLADTDHSMRVMTEESFAPVAAVTPVDGDEEAVARINDSRYGLTASVWTKDQETAAALGRRLEVGTVLVNRCDHLDPSLPWAGWKDSGVGLTMSHLGFDRMVKTRGFHIREKA